MDTAVAKEWQQTPDTLGIKEKSPVVHRNRTWAIVISLTYLYILHRRAAVGLVQMASEEKYEMVVSAAQDAYKVARDSAPQRGRSYVRSAMP